MKLKSAYVSENIYYKDIERVLSYIEAGSATTWHYLAFIQENYFE
ncbi:hypothetical protein [Ornithinibacillus caprae]|nr:hypothetical protein [Ornithinibacillus caprae]